MLAAKVGAGQYTVNRDTRMALTQRSVLRLLALLAIPPGCADQRQIQSQEDVSTVPVDTVGGTLIVRNGPEGVWAEGGAWTIREELRIGSVDGDPNTFFGGPLMSVGLGPHGQIFVLDYQADRISVFDGVGGFVRHIGGPGQGPGELSAPSAMGWDGLDRLWVANAFNGRYDVFDSIGTPLKTVTRQIRIAARLQHELKFDAAGSSMVDEGSAFPAVHLLRVDTTGTVDTLASLQRPDRPRVVRLPAGFDREVLRYLPSLVWALGPDNTVWLAESGELRLYQRTLQGDTIRIVETQHRMTAVDPGTERWAEREFSKVGLAPSDYTLVRPVVRRIYVLDDGHVLVQIVEEVGRDSPLLDVFDPEGRLLGTLRLGFAMNSRSMPALVGDTIVAVTLGEFDVPYVVRATILRPRF